MSAAASDPDDGDEERNEHIDVEKGTSEPPLPVTVEIPRLDVDAELVALGINDDGSMQVPGFGRAGWYANGPRPGARGPAVIAAHYDSRDGPDVFFRLATLEPGDEVRVRGADASTVRFIVERVEQHPKGELPGGRIWATTDEPRLTLITCGGRFDRSKGQYTDNVIVYTTRAD
ncbi:MAG: class F sortase [Nitriliruptoraceae bacterium]